MAILLYILKINFKEPELRQNQNHLSQLQRQNLDYKLHEPTLREFRLRTPPREQYHISERNTGIDRQPQKQQQTPQKQQYPPIVTQSQQNYTPQNFQAVHPQPLEYFHSPAKSQATSEVTNIVIFFPFRNNFSVPVGYQSVALRLIL